MMLTNLDQGAGLHLDLRRHKKPAHSAASALQGQPIQCPANVNLPITVSRRAHTPNEILSTAKLNRSIRTKFVELRKALHAVPSHLERREHKVRERFVLDPAYAPSNLMILGVIRQEIFRQIRHLTD
ncbi:hypothetical protein [Thioalkalivibrio sp. ALE16]|uniref:hypothetical protein n=1 Tax=Thioalkalivibrio sp. ALE16 TaxID=1158172 RepID=UPI0003798561|nr:hypothetical protein [Thioalkalivibrio sp. ALE16]